MKRHSTGSKNLRKVLTPEQKARLNAFRRYTKKWMNDTSGEQEESWKVLKQALVENRSGYRNLFSD